MLRDQLKEAPSVERLQELERRREMEEYELQKCKESIDWTSKDELYAEGRISGALEWKEARQETGRAVDPSC